MSRRGFALLLALLVCSSTVSADITLKKSFFTGWKYSTDGINFSKVGYSGKGLSNAMYGDQEAQSEMGKYKSLMTVSLIAAVPGGFLIGWPIGAYIGSSDWKDGYTTMEIVGGSLAVVSMVLESSATSHMKKAVEVYNGNQSPKVGMTLNWHNSQSQEHGCLMLGLCCRF
jgi:hypothetical protein